jgi:hypothetical protein
MAMLHGEAFMQVVCVEKAVNGFRNTDIFPLDPNIFPNWTFQPSETTDRPVT